MNNIYKSGDYLEQTQTWHAEDSPWKAKQILKILANNSIVPKTIADVGCGSGVILNELSKEKFLQASIFEGYDISPQAIAIANKLNNSRVNFLNLDLFTLHEKFFDLLLVIDVFEHVPDYMGFLERCSKKATYKIYHIPLEIHISSVARNILTQERHSIGHMHYFCADTALSTLKDTGHEILDYFYTNGAISLFKQHPSLKTAIANIPRWIVSKISVPLSARYFGGYSLMVLTK